MIKVVQKCTNVLFDHLLRCEGREVWMRVRGKSPGSAVKELEDGSLVEKHSFKQALPHHARFVICCFR